MSDGKKNKLELYLEAKFKEIDPHAHRTPGSGCGPRSKGDIANKFCAVEAKIKHTHENIIVDYKDEWQKTCDQMPLNSLKFPIVVIQNKYGENFVTLAAEDFFKLLKKANNGTN